MHIQYETITPQRAEELLGRNLNNRHLQSRYVKQLAGALNRGEWVNTGEPIQIAIDGTLLNGQHRLHACALANVSMQVWVAYDVDPVARNFMDQGKKRTMGDVLSMEGEKSVSQLASALTMLHRWNTGQIRRRNNDSSPTREQLLNLLEENPTVRESVQAGNALRKHVPVPNSSAIMAHFLCSQIDREATEIFFDRIADGANLGPGNPILVLRKNLFNAQVNGTHRRGDEVLGLLIKTWNKWRTGVLVQNLSLRSDEEFPVPTAKTVPVQGSFDDVDDLPVEQVAS